VSGTVKEEERDSSTVCVCIIRIATYTHTGLSTHCKHGWRFWNTSSGQRGGERPHHPTAFPHRCVWRHRQWKGLSFRGFISKTVQTPANIMSVNGGFLWRR